MTRYGNKMRIREAALNRLVANREDDFQFFKNVVTAATVQELFGKYLEKRK